MRVADKMSFQQVNSGLNKNRSEMQNLQNQAATQKRVNKPSDDPIAAARILKQKTELQGLDQYMKNVAAAKNFVEYSEQSLGDLSDVLIRVKELALGQAGDANANEDTRRVVASEVEQLFSQAVQIGNRKLGDRFLFSGFKTTEPAFDQTGEYRGDHGQMKIPIDKEAKVAVNIPGSAVFLGYKLTSDEESGNSSALRVQSTPDPISPEDLEQENIQTRGPASDMRVHTDNLPEKEASGLAASWESGGVNLFQVMNDLKISLQANDKEGVQDTIDRLDSALAQVVLARSQLGSRVTTLDQTLAAHQRGEVDAKIVKSQAEDVDAFELVSDINRAETTLKTSLQTSGKLLQPSLLDFLR